MKNFGFGLAIQGLFHKDKFVFILVEVVGEKATTSARKGKINNFNLLM